MAPLPAFLVKFFANSFTNCSLLEVMTTFALSFEAIRAEICPTGPVPPKQIIFLPDKSENSCFLATSSVFATIAEAVV